MPNEPDNKMDDLLKAYAQKRKADAGGPLELHPATRRLLQAEAARLRPKPEEKRDSWFNTQLAHWPRLAFGTGVLAVLGVTVWMLIPARQTEQMLLAKQEAPAASTAPSPGDANLLAKDASMRGLEEAVAVDKLSRLRDLPGDESKVQRGEGKAVELTENRSARFGEEVGRQIATGTPPPASPDATSVSRNSAVPSANAPAPQLKREMDRASIRAPAAPAGQPTELNLSDASVEQESIRRKDRAGETALYFNLGRFTNSLQSLAASSPQQFRDGAGGLEANRRDSGPTTSSDKVALNKLATNLDRQLNQPGPSPAQANARTIAPQLALEQSVALANNENRALPQLNQARPPAAGKDANGAKAESATANTQQSQTPVAQAPPSTSATDSKTDEYYLKSGVAQDFKSTSERTAGARFAQTPADTESGRLASHERGAVSQVLGRFELEQRGDRVRVVDADGSIYEGTVLPADDSNGARLGAVVDGPISSETRLQTARRNSALTIGDAPAEKKSKEDSSGRQFAFRVMGTNDTLKLPVTLEGTWWTAAAEPKGFPAITGQQPPARGPASDTKNIQRAAGLVAGTNHGAAITVQRVSGQARIGLTNEVQIDAVRAGN